MIRLTVLYNLPEGASEEDFLDWRLSEHQESNESMSGVIRTDFAQITENWPEDSLPAFRFQTTADWSDRESFEAGFRNAEAQARLQENLKKLGEFTFFVSEILIASDPDNSN